MPWRRKLATPVRRIQHIALAILILLVALLVSALGWLVYGVATGGLDLALWQQLLIVVGLVVLMGLAALAFRVAFFARVVRSFLR